MRRSGFRSIVVTAILWTYFTVAFAAGYWLVLLIAGILRQRRGVTWALGRYIGSFFGLARLLVRRLRIEVPARHELRKAAGAVVVCNHISFLDPLLVLWYLPRAITIVRPDFFRVPIFGWILRGAGFLGPGLFAEGQPWIDRVAKHLHTGGNLLIFPEGTRSRDGQLARFKKGAFYLAKHLGAPILVLKVAGTDDVFPPGRMVFNAAPTRPIEIRALARISVAEASESTTHELTERVYHLLGGG